MILNNNNYYYCLTITPSSSSLVRQIMLGAQHVLCIVREDLSRDVPALPTCLGTSPQTGYGLKATNFCKARPILDKQD